MRLLYTPEALDDPVERPSIGMDVGAARRVPSRSPAIQRSRTLESRGQRRFTGHALDSLRASPELHPLLSQFKALLASHALGNQDRLEDYIEVARGQSVGGSGAGLELLRGLDDVRHAVLELYRHDEIVGVCEEQEIALGLSRPQWRSGFVEASTPRQRSISAPSGAPCSRRCNLTPASTGGVRVTLSSAVSVSRYRDSVNRPRISTTSFLVPSGRVGSSNPVWNQERMPRGPLSKYRCKAYASVASQDFPGVAGPDENGQRAQLDARPGNRSEVGHVERQRAIGGHGSVRPSALCTERLAGPFRSRSPPPAGWPR